MNTEDLKKKIGRPCWARDPRSKKGNFREATVIAVRWYAQRINNTEIIETVRYTVELTEQTKVSSGYAKGQYYNRSFDVSGHNIQF